MAVGSDEQRVAITGAGAVSPAGRGLDAAVGVVDAPARSPRPRLAALAADGRWLGATIAPAELSLEGLVPARRRRRLGRAARMLLIACDEALVGAGLAGDGAGELGLVCGTGLGNPEPAVSFLGQLTTEGVAGASPSLFPGSVMSATAGQAAIELGARGHGATISQAELSGELAVIAACDALRLGRATTLLAAGVDEASPAVGLGLGRLGVLAASDRPERGGVLLGEGAGALVLETIASCRRRGAAPMATMASQVACGVGPAGAGAAIGEAIAAALDGGGVAPSALSFVFSSACGRPERDADEVEALAALIAGRRVPTVTLHDKLGSYLADGALRVAAAARMLAARGGGESRHALVLGRGDDVPYGGDGGEPTLVVALLLSRPGSG